MSEPRKRVKLTLIGGGSQSWSPHIIRDIICKAGMERVDLEFALLDLDLARAEAIKRLFDVKLAEWKIDSVTMRATDDKRAALTGADFVLITISTGRLAAMRWDLEIPEKYGIYHTVGDTAGPGGWARALRNIPVFAEYAGLIQQYCPGAFVLNYTNPMSHLTSVLARQLGDHRVVGLCHGLFTNYEILQAMFQVEEREIDLQFGGLNHFFWIKDFTIRGEDGYRLLREKLAGRKLHEVAEAIHTDSMGWHSHVRVGSELFEQIGVLPYLADRHTCEFFNCYMTNLELQQRFSIVRTAIADREEQYVKAEERIENWTQGRETDWGPLTQEPSRETAADIINAITFNEPFIDVVNLVNRGQIANLPFGATVETMGTVTSGGFSAVAIGELPEPVAAICHRHAEVEQRTTEAGLHGDLDAALLALAVDPVCAHLTVSDSKKLGMELLEANRVYLPQFFE